SRSSTTTLTWSIRWIVMMLLLLRRAACVGHRRTQGTESAPRSRHRTGPSRPSGTPNGIRTRATAVKGRRPRPLDDGGLVTGPEALSRRQHTGTRRPPPTRRRERAAGRPGRPSAQVALDRALGPGLGLARIATRVTERLALAQQVPALVELGLDAPQ